MNKKLFTYTRGTIPLYRLFIAIKSVYELATDLIGTKINSIFYAHENGKLWFSWANDEIRKVGYIIWEKTQTNQDAERHFDKIKVLCQNAIKAVHKIKGIDLCSLTNKDLIILHKQFYNDCKEAHGLTNVDIDAVDIVPVELLQKLIKEQLKHLDQKDFLNVYTLLTVPIHTSYIAEEEVEFLQLLQNLKINNISLNNLKASRFYKDFKKIIEKYWWTGLGWENMALKNEGDYLNQLKNYIESINNYEIKIKEIKNNNKTLFKKRNEIIKKYNLNEVIKQRLKFFDEYAALHDLRKEMQVKTAYCFHILLTEFAKRLGIDVHALDFYMYDELYDFLIGNKIFDRKEAQERMDAEFLIAGDDGIKLFYGKDAVKKINEIYKKPLLKQDEIRGICSSPGYAKGTVKVCNGAQEAIAKIHKGDILVCGMTLPEYIVAMRKAAAIVTDEGGITSHAAIVSRELGIPCITGTKIATQILKDDMVVEVDATHGIVRKVK